MNKRFASGMIVLGLMLGLAACGQQTTQSTASSSKATASTKVSSKASAKASAATSSSSSSSSHHAAAVVPRTTTSSSSSASASSSSAQQTPWSPAKSSALASFMQSWGTTMKQQYQSYWQGNSVNFYGLAVPDDLASMPPAMGDHLIDVGLSTDGRSDHDYTVVAIYSDAATARYMDKHLYLFTLHAGQPVVLVTMQNQGNENNWLYFDASANADLQQGFAAIVNGK